MSDDLRSNYESFSNEDTDVGSFNFDIEELDDAEYQIPQIVEPPTLESILNDPDDRISLNDDSDSLNWSQGILSSPLGIEGGSETVSLASRRSRSSSDRKDISSSSSSTSSTAFLRYVLLKGISTQISSAERINAGFATAITVTTMVAVGTSCGLILVFDSGQTLKWYLSGADEEQGPVSCLCFNSDSTRLLVGYARGHILMFDLSNGKLIRTLVDVHPPGTAVLSVKFTDLPTVALCSDSGGSVFELNFTRTLGVRGCSSKCLFSGSRGEVCVIEPLLLHHLAFHPLKGIVLVAMATLTKVIVVSIRPKMKVVFVKALPPGSTLLPLVDWQFVVIHLSDNSKTIDPVLAFAKDNCINFFQISVDSDSKLKVAALQKLVVNYSLLSLHWLNSWTIAAVDISERLHLLEVHSHEELENLDISNIGLVYESSNFKGIMTGGNVSEAMALAGEKACYNTIVGYGNQILILGMKTVHLLTIRPWIERLNYLVKQKKYLTALSLGLSFYEEPKGAVGLKGSRERRREIAKGKVVQILEQFIEDMESPIDDISATMQYAISVQYVDIIFNKLWEYVYIDSNLRRIFLEAMEPFILNDQLTSIPPAILQHFVNTYENTGKLQALEACIIHLDIGSLDLHQVVQVCWAHGLYDAIIFVHNKALNDYISPIHELVPILQKSLASGGKLTAKEVELGNKLLVYVSCCLAGRGFPVGDVPKDSVQQVKYDMFKCLTNIHSKDADDSELPYPYLRTLIHFDTREFLNVVSLAFTEPEFTSEVGLRQRQRLIDILLNIMVYNPGCTMEEIGGLYIFLARQLSRPGSGLQVDKDLFGKIFEYLTTPDLEHQEERQQALLDILRTDGLQEYSKETILELATEAKLVCEAIHEQNGEWDQVFLCYLQDSIRRPQVFSFLRNILLLYKNTKDAEPILNKVCSKIEDLMNLDIESTSTIVATYAIDRLPELLDNLKNDKHKLALLQSLLYRRTKEPICENDSAPLVQFFNKFIRLVLVSEPKSAVYELKTHSELYNVEDVMKIARECNHREAEAFLLEKNSNFKEAFEVLNKKLTDMLNSAINHSQSELEDLVKELIGIIQRSHSSYTEPERHKLWISLLDVLIASENSVKPKEKTRLIGMVLGGTMGHANPSAILEHLLHGTNSVATFGEIRHLLTGMLENTWFEEQLVKTTQKLVCSDLYSQLVYSLNGAKRGIRLSASVCSACNKSLSNGSVLVLFCGHPLHKTCFTEHQCPICATIAVDKMASTSSEVIRLDKTSASSKNILKSQYFNLKVTAPPAPDLENLERNANVLLFK
ncbi:hypothetical protein RUM44_002964 [Polyplax serrata]|uniref:RING-type domain-containing protein n=1 Tax=Polyplax serrata TaxID=468196 RepID=A0ABR1AX61_POLSC